jgi:wyosine [tRNA(Phe)-imidazoG37] synthetase (radical SAM superfamily)
MAADAVLPSLDAGSEMLYRRINRPSRGLSLADHVNGMSEFRRAYRGGFWVEVMLLGGMNDSEAALHDIANMLEKVDPDEIHLSTPIRPPAEPWVECPSCERTERAASILGRVAKVLPSTDVEAVPPIGGELVDAVLSIVARHPLRESEVESLLTRWLQARVEETLDALSEDGRIQIVERYGERFWCAAGLLFPNLNTERRSLDGPMRVSERP